MNDEAERDRLGRALNDHEIGRVIGRGQFGVVWSARHIHLSREVAVKRLDDQIAMDAEHSARFRREARTLAQLDHKHVVAVHDYREVDGMRLLVMELLRGGTLADRRSGGMPIETAVAATLAAASGLHHVHRSGVLHRDIKPENLMFDAGGILKVTDFGLARGDSHRETALEVSRVGTFFGTPAYVAPEQAASALAEGWPDVAVAADQYSLAAVLYESLSGQLTHDPTGGGVALCTRRMNQEARPLAVLAPDVPAPIAAVVMKALARDPAQRYASTEDFAVALAEAANTALGPGWVDRAEVGIREPGPILDAVNARGTAGATPTPTPSSTPTPAPTPSRSRIPVTIAAVVVVLALVAGGLWLASRSSDEDQAAGATTTAVATALPLAVEAAWSAPTNGDVFSSPALTDDLVVVGSDDGSLRGFDRATGAVRWTHPTGGPVSSSPVVDGGAAFVGSDDGSVHSVDVTTGAVRWVTPIGFEIVSSPAAANGIVVIGADQLYALDAATGARRWAVPTDAEIISSPAIDDDTVIIGSNAGTLYGVGLNDGVQRWSVDLGGPIQSSPRTLGGVAYVGTSDGRMHAVGVADGAEKWSVALGAAVKSSPAVTPERVVVGTDGGRLVALDPTTGSITWTWQGSKQVDSSPAVGDGWVAVGSNDTSVHFIDLDDGTEVGRFTTGGPVLSSPRVGGDIVYVGSHDDKVYALTTGPKQ